MAKKRVLLVEDNDRVRDFYAEEIALAGYDVVTAVDGADALRKVRKGRPDVIVLDIAMPEKTGLEFLSELAGVDGSIPVIVNTAYPHFKFDFRSIRAAAWLTKSSNPDKLLAAIGRAAAGENGNASISEEEDHE
ncbi:MAG: response regulator [bacterium]